MRRWLAGALLTCVVTPLRGGGQIVQCSRNPAVLQDWAAPFGQASRPPEQRIPLPPDETWSPPARDWDDNGDDE